MPEDQKYDLRGQVAIVTGGGRGTGRAFAQALAEAGASVAVTARTQIELEQTVELIRSAGGHAISIQGDVSDSAAVERVVKTTELQLGPVDILVNNAGVTGPVGAEWEADPDDWWRTMEINLRGPYLMTRGVLPGMVSQKCGRIINISSAVTVRTFPYFAPYTVSKAAIIYYTQNLAGQVKEHGISVFAYHPGGPETEMSRYLAESSEVHESVGNIFRGLYERGAHTPMEIPVRDVMLMASGKADALTGRFLIHTDDQEEMLARVGEIERDDLYVLTRRT
ncbi:MAG: SDR family oxidoreductase [SAR202 cluster bacterium]|jgi:NAD(P)-dependent dehydrogenase (short-subunit alcohol dehydrogenase family)|nr:SDR family oxidoreductase [SAR202 cluster bacterium]